MAGSPSTGPIAERAELEEWSRKGKLVRTAGLRPTREGFRVRSRYGDLTTTDGPFTESKEVIGGYAIIEAKDRDEAVRLTDRTDFPALSRAQFVPS